MKKLCKRIFKLKSSKYRDKKFGWLDEIDYKKFVTPFVLEKDNQYFDKLRLCLNELIYDLEKNNVQNEILIELRKYKKLILEAVELYYQGDLVESQSIINDLIEGFDDDSGIAISQVNHCPALGCDVDKMGEKEVQFFRARLNESVEDFSANEMFHIPFNKRELVKSERFSIPGLPCLYLGNTSYACWIEMGAPADYKFNVSPVLLDNSQRVLNLCVTIRSIISEKDNFEFMEEQVAIRKIITMFKLNMLNISTSYRVLQDNRNFKSEYIVSQMIMLACKKKGLDGIVYHSKRVSDEIFACVVAVNLVLFATYLGEEKLSTICDHIQISTSFNYSMFKQLMHSLKYKPYELMIDSNPYISAIGTYDRQFPYRETEFYEFDKYLFANWNR